MSRLRGCCLLLGLAALFMSSSQAQVIVNVKLEFQGMSQSLFSQYASSVSDTIAAVAGVPTDYVWQVRNMTATSSSSSNSTGANSSVAAPSMLVGNAPSPSTSEGTAESSSSKWAASSSEQTSTTYTPGRHLLAIEVTTVEYAIKSNTSAGPWADPVVIRRKFLSSAAGFGQASSAGFGKGFYAMLEKNGVPYEPTVYLDGVQILAGGLTTEAPESKFGQRHKGDPKIFDANELTGDGKPSVVELRDVRAVTLPSQPTAHQQQLAPWLIGVIVAGAVLALALTGMLVWKFCLRSRDFADDASQTSTERQFITNNGNDAPGQV